MTALEVDVDTSGPLWDGRTAHAIEEATREAQQAVGNQALAEVHFILDQRIRRPTPYYETQLMVERRVDDVVAHDRGVIYGPWLEGTGSRNKTTRFKGYAAFRKAAQMVDRMAGAITERTVRRYLSRMN